MVSDDFDNWAEVYDIVYEDRYDNIKEDADFYENLMKNSDPPILEMACGTGRLYIEYLEKGYNIHGSDISEGMLDVLKDKCAERNLNPTLYHGDSKKIEIDNKYGFIYYPFSSLQHLRGIEDQKKTFQNIYEHLNKNGTFAFDLPKPSFEYIKENYGKLMQENVTKDDTEYIVEFWSEISNEAKMECDLSQRVINNNENKVVYESTFELTLLPKEQVEMLLEYTGFSDYEIYADYDNDTKFTDEYDRMCFVASK